MNFLVSICSSDYQPIWNVVGFIVKTIWIGVPILLIVLGMVDLGKAVIASKEDEVKKATKAFGKRFLYAVAVFLVVWLVGTVLSLVTNVVGDEYVDTNDDWKCCWDMAIKGDSTTENCTNID